VFVDRSSTQSRHEVALAIGDSIKNRKKGVILFPEGTSSVRGKAWKKGAFHIANKMGLRVQPVRIVYTPARKIAYVERDVFVPHLLRLLKLGSFEVDVEVGPVTQILDVEADRSRLEAWVQGGVREALERQGVRD
jgi:1-acyl-sn-glycerol-3-phosphate acyltransferase